MVVSGIPSSRDEKPELIDLKSQNLICPSIEDYPYNYYGSSGTFINNKAMVCGGFDGYHTADCYSYDIQVKVIYQNVQPWQLKSDYFLNAYYFLYIGR